MVSTSREKQLKLDPVAQRLIELGDDHAVRVLAWLDSSQQRKTLRRRAFICSLGGWLLISFAAFGGALIAWIYSNATRDLVAMIGKMPPMLIAALPIGMAVVAVCIVIGGLILLMRGQFPGLHKAQRAIDWAGVSEAISRLLSAGATYPDAFVTAAKIAETQGSRQWLLSAAERVERGGPDIGTTNASSGDVTVVELLLESSRDEASEKWRLTSDHFVRVAQHRLSLLLGTVPIFSTLIAGAFLWVSISVTLGWMWKTAFSLIDGLS